MAHVRQVLALDAIGGFSHVFGSAQLQLQPLTPEDIAAKVLVGFTEFMCALLDRFSERFALAFHLLGQLPLLR
jgi:hypothetical protein